MGNEFSIPRQQAEEYMATTRGFREAYSAMDREMIQSNDQRTSMPHLQIQLRNLGFVEVCGKDVSGIYERLTQWLRENWECEPASTEAREAIHDGWTRCPCNLEHRPVDLCCICPAADYLLCGCAPCGCKCGRTGLALMENQELLACDRLNDASFVAKRASTGLLCRTLSLNEVDRHYPIASWYCSRVCCACLVSKPPLFKSRKSGETNLGKLTMQMVAFMTQECGWHLKGCSTTNLGWLGDIREQQMEFRAPSPSENLVVSPHLMIEFRMEGRIAISGPNTNGIYEKLGEWFTTNWKAGAPKSDPDFCDLLFHCSQFCHRGHHTGIDVECNIGFCTTEVVDFMVKDCGWTFVSCSGMNCGTQDPNREQQIVFRADPPAAAAKHIMVELRDPYSTSKSGFIEVHGVKHHENMMKPLDQFLKTRWRCKDHEFPTYCEKKYITPEGFFFRNTQLTSNMSKKTIELASFMATQGFIMSLCSGSATHEMRKKRHKINARLSRMRVGEEFEGKVKREQQIKFSKAGPSDTVDAPLLIVDIRAVAKDPEVENVTWLLGPRPRDLLGRDIDNDIKWRMQKMYRRATRREEIDRYIRGDHTSQAKFCKKGALGPDAEFQEYRRPRWEQDAEREGTRCGVFEAMVEVNGRNTNRVHEHLENFVTSSMHGRKVSTAGWSLYCDALFRIQSLRFKRVPFPIVNPRYDGHYLGETNFGIYTTRLADFLIDQLGGWELVACNGHVMERAWKVDRDRVLFMPVREQQLIFRHTGKGWSVVENAVSPLAAPLGRAPLCPPDFWTEEAIKGTVGHAMEPCTDGERRWLETMLNNTFCVHGASKPVGVERFQAVVALRSEHPALWDSFAQRRKTVAGLRKTKEGFVSPMTCAACPELFLRLRDPMQRNRTNEAYLFHGTSPSHAQVLLNTGFSLDFVASGSMFGHGLHFDESSLVADGRTTADVGGPYDGLSALVVCRATVGRCFVTAKPGVHDQMVKGGAYDSVCGQLERPNGDTYREFVFFHEGSVYPEFVFFYRRTGESGRKASGSAGTNSTPSMSPAQEIMAA